MRMKSNWHKISSYLHPIIKINKNWSQILKKQSKSETSLFDLARYSLFPYMVIIPGMTSGSWLHRTAAHPGSAAMSAIQRRLFF